MKSNITWHDASVGIEHYRKKNNHHSGVIWLTGLSGSGKSSIANRVNQRLFERGVQAFLLDGDNVRHGLNKDLTFTPEDREENIRRIGEVAKLFAEGGTIILTAFISPYQADRDQVRHILSTGDFVEVHVDCPIDECEKRDPKGLYKKARKGEIKGFTGVDAPYEKPDSPEIVLHSDRYDEEECARQLVSFLESKGWI
ncbi:adenylyl-sulfate kinase [Halobacillus yeomjeoni]|uniref:Adenylyl-sulfate kinase n=1 Tax=Halobacillus yeomjeoni TaxID=311194 RepID=A0A931HTW0_9BACI|nr:adenylyl-sulfate kinase [Halobacillus yeomjeoni]MBH0229464.1 adenylyl-sulfate kinase [Halobacillus yeomjeoni]